MRHDITVRGEKAERWQATLDQLEQELGYRPNQPEALGILMAAADLDDVV